MVKEKDETRIKKENEEREWRMDDVSYSIVDYNPYFTPRVLLFGIYFLHFM